MEIRKALALIMITTGLIMAPFIAVAAFDSDLEVGEWFDSRDRDGFDIDIDWDDDFDLDWDIDIDWDDDIKRLRESTGQWQSDDGEWHITWGDGSIDIDFSGSSEN